MRLDDYDPNAIDVVDQRGSGRRSFGRAGGSVGCGTIIIALIAYFVFGADPAQLIGGLQDPGATAPVTQQQGQGGGSLGESCAVNQFSKESCDVLSSLNKTWEPLFRQANVPFKRPTLNFYSQTGDSGCGTAQSAMGPFYCPSDQGIYIDTDFYTEMEQKLGAGGDFARLYVIAHEYGHHIQMLTGIADDIRSKQERYPRSANQLQVRMELQADCYAGVWAGLNKDRIDPGDMEEGLNAAHSIGDDTLMRRAGRRPVEEAFTHGSSAERMKWLRAGMESGNDEVCDRLMR